MMKESGTNMSLNSAFYITAIDKRFVYFDLVANNAFNTTVIDERIAYEHCLEHCFRYHCRL